MSRRIELRGVPVDLWLRLQEHTDALFREFRLMPEEAVPDELARLLRAARDDFPRSVVPRLRDQVRTAADRGRPTADIGLDADAAQAELMTGLHERLCQIDEYCRKGVLLTLPLAAEIVTLRGWVVREISRQVHGAPGPAVWPPPEAIAGAAAAEAEI